MPVDVSRALGQACPAPGHVPICEEDHRERCYGVQHASHQRRVRVTPGILSRKQSVPHTSGGGLRNQYRKPHGRQRLPCPKSASRWPRCETLQTQRMCGPMRRPQQDKLSTGRHKRAGAGAMARPSETSGRIIACFADSESVTMSKSVSTGADCSAARIARTFAA